VYSLQFADSSYLDLDGNAGIARVAVFGAGMPPLGLVTTPYGLADGALYQRTGVKPRTITFHLDFVAGSFEALRDIRAQLIAAVNPHRQLPVRIWYNRSGAAPLYIDAYYDAGLEGGKTDGLVEPGVMLRLVAVDPYWQGAEGAPKALDTGETVAGVSYVVHRGPNGAWDTMGGGVNNPVRAVAVAPDGGGVYVGGAFSTAGAVAASRIARWDGSAWHALGSGLNGLPHALLVAPDGKLYAGGEFTTAGGVAANHIAVWDGASWAALGAGVDDTVFALTLGLDGSLYAGGNFTTAGGGAANYVARWTGSAWQALSSGLDSVAYALATGRDGSIYAGGLFTTAGGTAANYVARWTGSAWKALGDGMYRVSTPAVYALAVDLQGRLVVGGLFTAAGGIAARNIARWSGAGWEPLGAGFNSYVYRLYVSPEDGALTAMGAFTATGDGRPMPAYVATWGDGIWLSTLGGRYSVAHSVDAMAIAGGDVYLGGNFAGYDWLAAGRDTITNPSNVRAYPVFTITGPGTLYHIINYTTGQAMHFNLLLSAGEVLTIDLRPGAKTISSNQRGNLISALYSGSLVDWYLEPGANDVSVWVDDATASATATFAPRYWSVDMVPAP
jgi:hypothetical protein